MDAEGALKRIMKHLKNPKKFSKCLKMVLSLIEEHFDFISGDSLFLAFDTVMKCKHRFDVEGDRLNVEKLYFKLVELSSASEEYDESCMFSDQQTAILDLYYIPVYMQSSLYKDDFFKLNQVFRDLTSILSVLPHHNSKFEKHKDWFKQIFKPEQE